VSHATAAPASFWTPLWSLLVNVWSKSGCGIDPYGRCIDSPAPQNLDNGCGLDPYGRCLNAQAPSPQNLDSGCGADPYGRCLPGH
jgi:hypothetical protein